MPVARIPNAPYPGMSERQMKCPMKRKGCFTELQSIEKERIYPLLDPLNELIEVADNMSNGRLDYKPQYTADARDRRPIRTVNSSWMILSFELKPQKAERS